MNTPVYKVALSFALLSTVFLPAKAEKLFDYSFDNKGTKEPSGRGAVEALELNLIHSDGAPFDIRSGPGTGVSGKPWDRAFDGTSATGMGKSKAENGNNRGPVAVAVADTAALSSLVSYTISGWMRTTTPIESVARIVVCTVVGRYNSVLELRATPVPGGLTVDLSESIDTKEAKRQNSALNYLYHDEWTFFAVTFAASGDKKTNAMEFFIGTKDDPIQRAGVSVYNGKTPEDMGVLAIGNIKNGLRPFKGLLDNIRIHGSVKDASGALTMAQLEALRKGDIVGVPPKK